MTLPDPELDNPVARRAADFVQRQQFWSWSEDDQRELDAWLAESPLHLAAYLRTKGILAYSKHLAAVHSFEIDRTRSPRFGWLFSRSFLVPLTTLSLLVFLVLAAPTIVSYLTQVPVQAFSTEVGGRSKLHFADGTEFEVNTDTSVRYRMTNRERTVWLDRGEAWFHVAHNAANPFTVIIGTRRVTDLGTELLIRRGPDVVKVSVINGRADLSSDLQTATLRPGDEAVATPFAVTVTRKTPAELADELAWRNGVVVFHNTRLADAVREINRYNSIQLVVADPAIADVKISTNLRVDATEPFVQLAEAALNLRIEREGNEILLFGHGQKHDVTTLRTKHGR